MEPRPTLPTPRAEAVRLLEHFADKVPELLAQLANIEDDQENEGTDSADARTAIDGWIYAVGEALRHMFSDNQYLEQFSRADWKRESYHSAADIYSDSLRGRQQKLLQILRIVRAGIVPETLLSGNQIEARQEESPQVNHATRIRSMSIKEDADRILQAIAEFEKQPGDPKRGRHNLSGKGIETALSTQQKYEMPPERINDGVKLLHHHGFVDVDYSPGTSPFFFSGVELNAIGRLRYEEMNETAPGESSAKNNRPTADPKKVFVIHGRDEKRRKAIFDFLRAIGLQPIEWSQARALTAKAAPYIGEILDAAFGQAQAVVVLLTGDDEARIRSDLLGSGESEEPLTPQARPNVLFEAGMAMGSHAKRTVFVEIGKLRPFSDVAGRHTIRLNTSGGNVAVRDRQEIVARLKDAGCDVDQSGSDWHTAGDF